MFDKCDNCALIIYGFVYEMVVWASGGSGQGLIGTGAGGNGRVE